VTKTGPSGPQPAAMRERSVAFRAGLVADVEQQVAHHEPGRQECQGNGHVAHGALGRLHARFSQDGQAVAHRLDTRVGACSHAVCAQHQEEDTECPQLRRGCARVDGHALRYGPHLGGVGDDGVDNGKGMRGQEEQEDGHQRCN
jgi:hypothetical protein